MPSTRSMSWFDLGGGDPITHGVGVLVWYGAPLRASLSALVAVKSRRIALLLAAVCVMLGWLEFYWSRVTLNQRERRAPPDRGDGLRAHAPQPVSGAGR